MTNQLYLDKRITRFFNVAPEPLYRVHHIAEDDGFHDEPTEYLSATQTEAEADAKIEEMRLKGIYTWKEAEEGS